MWIADHWKDYEVLDTSSGEKLERWGDYILVRPDPQVIWKTPHDHKGWKQKNGHYEGRRRMGVLPSAGRVGDPVHPAFSEGSLR